MTDGVVIFIILFGWIFGMIVLYIGSNHTNNFRIKDSTTGELMCKDGNIWTSTDSADDIYFRKLREVNRYVDILNFDSIKDAQMFIDRTKHTLDKGRTDNLEIYDNRYKL